MKKLLTGITTVLLCSLFFTVTAWAVIKIGIAGPLSGSTLTIGEQQEIGALLAIDHLNEQGGLLGQEIVAISVDDACDPEQAVAVARQLISENVAIVIGHLCSGCSLAVGKIYEDAGIIMMTPASTNPKVTDDGGPNIFRVVGRDDQQGTIAGDFLADKFADRRIAIIHDEEAYGMGLADFTRRQLNIRGIAEVLFTGYLRDQPNYNELVDQLSSTKTEVVYAGGYLADIAIILRQAKRIMPDLLFISGDSLAHPEFLSIAGEAGAGTYFTFGQDMRLNPQSQDVVREFRNEQGYEPEGYTLYSYGAVQAWAQAVNQAQTLDHDKVALVLKSMTFDTVIGKIGFDEKGDVTGIKSFVWNVFSTNGYEPFK